MKLDKPAGWELLRFLLITFSSSNPLSRLKWEGRLVWLPQPSQLGLPDSCQSTSTRACGLSEGPSQRVRVYSCKLPNNLFVGLRQKKMLDTKGKNGNRKKRFRAPRDFSWWCRKLYCLEWKLVFNFYGLLFLFPPFKSDCGYRNKLQLNSETRDHH